MIPAYMQLNDIVQQYSRKIHRVAPDGNCLFRGLSHQAFGDQMYCTQMRKAIVTQMRRNTNHFILKGIHFMSMLVLCTRMAPGVHNWKYKQLLIASDYQYTS